MGGGLCLVGGSVFAHGSAGLAMVLTFVLMLVGGLGAAFGGHFVLRLEEPGMLGATFTIIVGLLPGVPAMGYWLGGRGDVLELPTEQALLDAKGLRYVRLEGATLRWGEAIRDAERRTVKPKNGPSREVMDHSVLVPVRDAASGAAAPSETAARGSPGAYVLFDDLVSQEVKSFKSTGEERVGPALDEARAKLSGWYRRVEPSQRLRELSRARGRPIGVALAPVGSLERDRFFRALWISLLAALAALGVGLFTYRGLRPVPEKQRPADPYRSPGEKTG